ncbi:UNVERIFIED_CONTAM: AarF domain-containing protein kinase [Sesamum radiatum]|uniref:AarF domain-containing protein kinase n=1 Tax=Sesamum radiatum TaxID=300843 RepID=A0AAW2IZC0_SESRA
MRRYGGVLKFGAKTSVYLLTAAGCAALAHDSFNSSDTLDSPFGFLNGVISSCVIDYKYTLRGLPAGSDEYGRVLSELHLRSARRILKLCDANKGFYVKAGQFVAAMRQVPREYSLTLSSLQDQAVPCNFEAVKEVIVKSLGKDLSEIFLSFDEKPVAAASIAQVHRAVLKDHQEVAVKVNDLEFLNRMGISPLEVAKALVDVFSEMIFVHGFLHGDPHPGNILVSPQGPNGFSLVILDHGIYKQLSEDFRKNYCRLWEALIILDSPKIQLLGETFGVGKYARYFPVIFTGRTINSTMAKRGKEVFAVCYQFLTILLMPRFVWRT